MSRIEQCATGRDKSFLLPDWNGNSLQLTEAYSGARILVIGAAGSIGRAVTKLLIRFKPHQLHLIDISENGLADLIRELRMTSSTSSKTDFKTFCIDVTSGQFKCFARTYSYDYTFNLSALKHVRLEKDDFSLTRALNVNIASHYSILDNLNSLSPKGYFAVSTDKAAYPANYMGLSKRLMEFYLLESEKSYSTNIPIVCARFANVAFSAGSLLNSWHERLKRKEPIVVPINTFRFFISHEEAAQICVLSLIVEKGRYVTIPRDTSVNRKKEMLKVAEKYLEEHGFSSILFTNEKEALRKKPDSVYPILLTPRDTAGEKEEEIFSEKGESIETVPNIRKLKIIRKELASSIFQEPFHNLIRYIDETTIIKRSQLDYFAKLICPTFDHISAEKNLDEKI